MVLDGPVDATNYINHPMTDLAAQTAAFERALGRFFQACAADQDGLRRLRRRATRGTRSTSSSTRPTRPRSRPTATRRSAAGDGDDVLEAAIGDLYAKQYWPELAGYLADAANGDGSGLRFLSDLSYGRNDDGTYDPGERPLLHDRGDRAALRHERAELPRRPARCRTNSTTTSGRTTATSS